MSPRTAAMEEMLARNGLVDAGREPLPGDASFRRYVRLRARGHSVMLMDAPPEHENVRNFVLIARHLEALGLSAPRVLDVDEVHGLALVEDLGETTFTRLLDGGADPEPLYDLAVDVLVALHEHPRAKAIDVPVFDRPILLDGVATFVEWWWPAATGRTPSAPVVEAWSEAWRQALAVVDTAIPRTLVLRDFHVDNLMRLEGRSGVAGCGLLDFQDALIGPAPYDLVSLAEDARRDLDPALRRRITARYLDARPDVDRAAFAASSAVLAAQRHARVIGVFTRLWQRDGKPGYLRHLPRLWSLFEARLAEPPLAPVANWVETNVPRSLRGALPEAAA